MAEASEAFELAIVASIRDFNVDCEPFPESR
jgi:hypothetical protein